MKTKGFGIIIVIIALSLVGISLIFFISQTSQRTKSPVETQQPIPQNTSGPTQNPTIKPSPKTAPPQVTHKPVKVLNIFFIPPAVHPIYSPDSLTKKILPVMRSVSNNSADFVIVDTQTVDRSTTKKADKRMDYNALLSEFNVCSRLNSGEIDEVWVWVNGADGAGWEWIVSGDINYPGGMNSCGKNLVVMGFDYTRTYDLALHSLGHRMEYLANEKNSVEYNSWKKKCGNVHFPPNGIKDYDYENTTNVQTYCDGIEQTVNCSAWSCSQEGYMKWWFSHTPTSWWSTFLYK